MINIGGYIIQEQNISKIDYTNIENRSIKILMHDGQEYGVYDFDALRIAIEYGLPSLEGKRLRWVKHAWWFHNLIAHPLLQICVWLGFPKLGMKIHDRTIPKPIGYRS